MIDNSILSRHKRRKRERTPPRGVGASGALFLPAGEAGIELHAFIVRAKKAILCKAGVCAYSVDREVHATAGQEADVTTLSLTKQRAARDERPFA